MAKGNYRGGKGAWTLFFLLVIGGIAGSAVGAMLSPRFSWLKSATAVGFPPTTMDLNFLHITFGISLTINPLTILGLVLAYLVYQRT